MLKWNYSTVISKLCGASIFIGLSNLVHRYDAGFVLSLGGRIFTPFTQTEIAFYLFKNILFYFFNIFRFLLARLDGAVFPSRDCSTHFDQTA